MKTDQEVMNEVRREYGAEEANFFIPDNITFEDYPSWANIPECVRKAIAHCYAKIVIREFGLEVTGPLDDIVRLDPRQQGWDLLCTIESGGIDLEARPQKGSWTFQ
jgi:hypothetical protein